MTQYLAIALMSAGSLGRKRAGYLGIFTGGQSRDILRGGTTLAVQPRGGPLTTFADPAPCPSLPLGVTGNVHLALHILNR